MRINQEILIFF